MNGIPDNSEDAAEGSMTGMNALTQRHEELRAKNAVKIGILMACLIEKLEDIGEGGVFIGKYFPEEKMWEDLDGLNDTQIDQIHTISERYFQFIFHKLQSQ